MDCSPLFSALKSGVSALKKASYKYVFGKQTKGRFNDMEVVYLFKQI